MGDDNMFNISILVRCYKPVVDLDRRCSSILRCLTFGIVSHYRTRVFFLLSRVGQHMEMVEDEGCSTRAEPRTTNFR